MLHTFLQKSLYNIQPVVYKLFLTIDKNLSTIFKICQKLTHKYDLYFLWHKIYYSLQVDNVLLHFFFNKNMETLTCKLTHMGLRHVQLCLWRLLWRETLVMRVVLVCRRRVRQVLRGIAPGGRRPIRRKRFRRRIMSVIRTSIRLVGYLVSIIYNNDNKVKYSET